MSTAVLTEDELKKAVIAYAQSWAAAEPEEGKGHVFSARYEERKNQIIALAAKREGRASRRRIWRRAASVLAACMLCFCIVMAASPAAYAAVRSWAIKIYNKIVYYTFDHGEEEHAYVTGVPTWLPEGYEETERIDSYPSLIIVYSNAADGKTIVYSCSSFDGTDSLSIDHLEDDISPEKVSVNGTECYYYPPTEDSGDGELVFINENAGAVVVINSELSKEDVVRIAESIKF